MTDVINPVVVEPVKKKRGRFKKGQSGNPAGRPKGVQDRRTIYRDFLHAKAPELMQKCVDLAMEGDTHALRICLDRIMPRQRDDYVNIELPPDITTIDSLKQVCADILRKIASCTMTPLEAQTTADVVKTYRDTILLQDLEHRVNNIEKSQKIEDNKDSYNE